MNNAQRIDFVKRVHAEIDRRTAAFEARTELHCPDQCGQCCLSPEVETTVAELLPMAEEIVRRGDAGTLLDRLDERPDELRCVLYAPDSADHPGRGRCTMYALRPSVCRLFGFAGRRDGASRPQFVACRVHAQLMPDVVAAARAAVESGDVDVPIFSELAGRIAATAPGPAGRPQPINTALREAIGAAALAARLASHES
jgi:Fe-S-cluster containining protein